ncbi:unnamed protein product [Allacma fusca]|uniref:Uncharacterized protein n=1 Tax=Allacma fusca TaxID=39272 RepID=A0A8J2NQL0_9HEXA|nr:unnamed protein product [Allacma fusca]
MKFPGKQIIDELLLKWPRGGVNRFWEARIRNHKIEKLNPALLRGDSGNETLALNWNRIFPKCLNAKFAEGVF